MKKVSVYYATYYGSLKIVIFVTEMTFLNTIIQFISEIWSFLCGQFCSNTVVGSRQAITSKHKYKSFMVINNNIFIFIAIKNDYTPMYHAYYKFCSTSLILRWLKYINEKTKVQNKAVKTVNEREDRQLRGRNIIYLI